MKNVTIFKIYLIIALVFISIGAFLKIMHLPYAQVMLIIGGLSSLVFIILGLMDVFSYKAGTKPYEKPMWFTAFIFFPLIAGLLYLPKYIKRNK